MDTPAEKTVVDKTPDLTDAGRGGAVIPVTSTQWHPKSWVRWMRYFRRARPDA